MCLNCYHYLEIQYHSLFHNASIAEPPAMFPMMFAVTKHERLLILD